LHYLKAKAEEKSKREAFELYISEALRATTNNTARFAGGVELKQSYMDLIAPKRAKLETRTGDEIIGQMKERLNKLGGKQEDG